MQTITFGGGCSARGVGGPVDKVTISRLELLSRALASLPESERDMKVREFIGNYPNTPIIAMDSIAGIYYYGPAREVYINGDFQHGWSQPEKLAAIPCGENTFFHISLTLPKDARVDYQLIVDSVYMTDPRNIKITPSGYGPHSEIAMPGFCPDAARARFSNIPRGKVDSIFFTARDNKIQPRKIKIYLPAAYETYSDMPVLYVMDGLEALVWMDYPNVLDNMIAWKMIPPMIAVFIPPGDRGGEFMGDEYKQFQKVLCNEIVPLIDRKYKTNPHPSARGITGISAGGYFALTNLLDRTDVFGCGAGQSAAIGQGTYDALDALIKKGKYDPGLKIYFDVGRYDLQQGVMGDKTFLEFTREFHEDLLKLNVNHRFHIVNDGHEWASWRERTGEILQYFFR